MKALQPGTQFYDHCELTPTIKLDPNASYDKSIPFSKLRSVARHRSDIVTLTYCINVPECDLEQARPIMQRQMSEIEHSPVIQQALREVLAIATAERERRISAENALARARYDIGQLNKDNLYAVSLINRYRVAFTRAMSLARRRQQ